MEVNSGPHPAIEQRTQRRDERQRLIQHDMVIRLRDLDDRRFGAHQFREIIEDNTAFVTWFAAGLRILNFSNPEEPEELGYFIPQPGDRQMSPQTNDVEMDDRGLLYITDKAQGFDVIEFSG